jgi:CheY-like chemotaxis protein
MSACIAVIDDEPDLLLMVVDLLEAEGYRVITAGHPREVEEMVGGLRPDLFLIDVMLPGSSGIEVAEELRLHGYDETPMIAMSASKRMAQFATTSGVFQEVVVKPFDIFALLADIEGYVYQGASSEV